MTPLDELALLLRPAGGGLYLVSTGREAQEALQRKLYHARDAAEVDVRFRDNLARIAQAKAFVLGVPSDVGAGYRRGANLGPQAIRTALLEEVAYYPDGVIDIGDVFVVPQLLHDEMLSEAQKERTRRALYPNVAAAEREALPVSPLSIAERALDLVFAMNPRIAPIVLGGDHSTAWPVVSALSRARNDRWGIVQPDAHTDLLEERLGITYCYATWSWHANELFARDGRLVQVGTRASRHDRAHWEGSLGVRQLWAEECRRDPEGSIEAIVEHLRARNVTGVYFSNDIDGTDDAHADATGTPEPGGLSPDFVVALIRRLAETVGILGGDIMEVAPALQDKPDSKERTVKLAVRYLRETLAAVLLACFVVGCTKDDKPVTTPEPTAPAPQPAARARDKNFTLDVAAPGCRVGEECAVTIKLVATNGYHVNKEYPYKFVPAPAAPGITFLGSEHKQESETAATMTVRFKASSAGEAKIQGTYKMSVCSDENCLIDQEQVTVAVVVT